MAESNEIKTLYPHSITTLEEALITSQIHESLVRLDSKKKWNLVSKLGELLYLF